MVQNALAATVAITPAKAQAPMKLGFGSSSLLISENHGQMYEPSIGQRLFVGANPSGVTTSAGLATTYVGLCLSNPAGNTKNLVLGRMSASFIVAPATVTQINLITGYAAGGITVHTTALTPFSTLIGTGPVPTGKLDSACTLVGTPVFTLPLSETPLATTLPFFSVDLEGSIILPPGAYAAIGTTIAGPASGFQGGIIWEEVPVTG